MSNNISVIIINSRQTKLSPVCTSQGLAFFVLDPFLVPTLEEQHQPRSKTLQGRYKETHVKTLFDPLEVWNYEFGWKAP